MKSLKQRGESAIRDEPAYRICRKSKQNEAVARFFKAVDETAWIKLKRKEQLKIIKKGRRE